MKSFKIILFINVPLQLECCGYHSGIYFDFWTTQFQSTSGYFTPSIFCCHSNPLTKTYNYNTGCTTDTSSRYTEVNIAFDISLVDSNTCINQLKLYILYIQACRDKLSQRLLTYSIFFYVMMSVCLILEVTCYFSFISISNVSKRTYLSLAFIFVAFGSWF